MPDDIAQSKGSESNKDVDEVADRPTPRVGRRALMLGATTAGVGAAAALVASADPAAAADGSAVLLGDSNKASATTKITTKTGDGLEGSTSASGSSGVAGLDESGETSSHGIYGSSDSGCGVYGTTVGGTGVFGNATADGGYGVYGTSTNGNGVYGACAGVGDEFVIAGVYGTGFVGVYGISTTENGFAVIGAAQGTGSSYGIYASSENSYALVVDGTSDFIGAMSKPGGSFKIDHPVDPADKYLYHSFVESPDMKNVYDGTVTLDDGGRATVELPDWFEALNRDYRYQLTAIGGPAPELHISSRVKDGKFSIAGGKANQEVSWQVTGIRQDAWANANRIPVEVDKKDEDRGRYLHPELFGGEAITSL
ncbi:MAG: hypothetical protein WAM97_19910 [Acidimicrobiales bacterium]